MSRLEARGLVKAFGGRRVVDGVDLSVEPGQVVGLLGPNGAGKTTTFRMLAGLLQPDAGEVWLDGRPLRGPLHARVRQGLGYLPQRGAMLEGLTARQQLLIPLEVRGAPAEEAGRLLAELGLEALAEQPASSLSGGERKRLEIARCLATAPQVVLLDEPFAGVDPVSVAELSRQVAALARGGRGVLLTDHAAREALEACDEVLLLDAGRVMLRGAPEVIAADAGARARWLGEDFGR
ncbi:MAG: LPS export ABC transporter ATP-binding protein [Alphaproteobacteria bacterium]|nr:LPS export ABC transporter ATP-binding protein [Alphaproteobacteria bacterium]MCB9792543.1 LPS export ABC transporter ATP-binding protein [Alphaproteobacteria bacterium]